MEMIDDRFVALGASRYKVRRFWPTREFDSTVISDVAVMADGRVAALVRATPQLRVFTPDGEPSAEWAVPELMSGHYVSGRRDGGLLVADWDGHQILAVDTDGTCTWSLGAPERPKWMAPFNHPTSAAEGRDGRLYVSDGYGNFCVHRFGKDRKLQATLGKPGAGPGAFTTPHCVVLDKEGDVYVADRENNRIQVFDAEGTWKRQLGNLYKPMALAFTPEGDLLVTDQTPCLSRMTANGELLGRCRTEGTVGHGLDCAADGSIYIAEMQPPALTKLAPLR